MPTRAVTICPRCTTKHRVGTRCPVCAARRGTTTQRGYGTPHQRLRAVVAGQVASGRARCWRCTELIGPDEEWDLGHDDTDRRLYRGPEHVRCNRATSARR